MITRDEFREQVRERTDLIALVQKSGIEVRGAAGGRTVKVRCPFHADKTPSMAIYPEKNEWHCFGACATGGDVFAFVMKRDNCDFPQAVEVLAQDAGLELPTFTQEEPGRREERATLADIMESAAEYYHSVLVKVAAAQNFRDYLAGRGFGDRDLWQRWRLGAAGVNNGLVQHMEKSGIDLKLAEQLGLVVFKNDQWRDFFQNRLIIPFLEYGKTVYLTGRAISDTQQPKYLHLPNSDYAHKTPWNWRTSGKDLVIVEGALDAIAVDALMPSGVGVLALMGLGQGDPLLKKALLRRERVFVGLDSDGTVRDQVVENAAKLVGYERARLLRWPGGDDAAAWFQAGAEADAFQALLATAPAYLDEIIDNIKNAADADVPGLVEAAVEIGVKLPAARADGFINSIKKGTRGVVQAATINKLFKAAQPKDLTKESKSTVSDFYRVIAGELWVGDENPRRVLQGGYAIYTQMVAVDDGDGRPELDLEMEVRLADGRTFRTRIPARRSGEEAQVLECIRGLVGPQISTEPSAKKFIPPAIDSISRAAGLEDRTEIAHTGWVSTSEGMAYCTPGGVVGNLPDGYSIALPTGFSDGFGRIAVHDSGEESFRAGIDGLLNGFLKAFSPEITYPLLAFGLLPVASPWLPKRKFAMHLSGETGSLKTYTAKCLMSLYGGSFADSEPMLNWRSTINAIEVAGFWLPDMLAMVDDYKPSIVKAWDFTGLIQRYAEGNARLRLNQNSTMKRKQAMRAWLLSTGEDIPVGESSVLSRMILLRFARRPDKEVYNVNLAKAQRLAGNFPTVTARWAAWLRDHAEEEGLTAQIALKHQQLGATIQQNVPRAPNANRVAENLATLQAIWSAFGAFLIDQDVERDPNLTRTMAEILPKMAIEAARQVADEKPTRVFLDAVQAGLDSGRFSMQPVDEIGGQRIGLIGYFDDNGIYLLPAAYNEAGRWLRESGQQLGFYQKELYRLFDEEGLLVRKGKESSTVVQKVGPANAGETRRVLHLKRATLELSERKSALETMPGF